MPTIKDVARAAQVSVATVSRVLNQDKNVSTQTREKVLAVVQEIGYVTNVLGRNLRKNTTDRVLVLIPSLSNQFLSGVIRGMESEARKLHLQVMISATHNDPELERSYLELLHNHSVDGMILVGSTLPSEELATLSQQYPLVMCSEWEEGIRISAVGIDNERAGYDAVKTLLQSGRERIAMISNQEMYSARQRTQGYRRALLEAGKPFCPEYLIERYEYTYRAGMLACGKLMALPEPPDAIFAVSDEIAAGVCKKLLQMGLYPGKEVAVFGFDNTTVSKIVTPSVSTVSQPKKKIGETALHLLAEKIENQKSPERTILLAHELVLRESAPGKEKQR